MPTSPAPADAWPSNAGSLRTEQERLASLRPRPWRFDARRSLTIGGCFVCFPTGLTGAGSPDDDAWAAAALIRPGREPLDALVEATAGATYEPGLLALREGPVLEAAVRALADPPDVLIVNAAGRDHPRRAGLALHLGAVLDVPTVGVTHRPFVATGVWPGDERGASSPLTDGGAHVAAWVRTRGSRRPLVAHAAWRTDVDTAVAVVLQSSGNARTPEPLRLARRAAREARARAEGRAPPASEAGR